MRSNNNRSIFEICLAGNLPKPIFAVPKINAALVKGLRRLPFTEESRVRIPYVVQNPAIKQGFFMSIPCNQHVILLQSGIITAENLLKVSLFYVTPGG